MKTKEIIKSIEKLAEKLGKTSEELFGYYVKNAKLYKYIYMFKLVISVLLFLFGIFVCFKNEQPGDNWEIMNIIFFTSGIVMAITGFVSVADLISRVEKFINSFINPEYEATEDILSTLL